MRKPLIALIRVEASPSNLPQVPLGWDIIQETNDLSTVYPRGREANPDKFIHFHYKGRIAPLRGIFICFAPPLVLQHLENRIASDALAWTQTWPTLVDLRADVGVAATSVKSNWVDDRPTSIVSGPFVEPVVYGPKVGARYANRVGTAGNSEDDGETTT